jgi:hypothetical protein
MWLDPIPAPMRERAVCALDAGDVEGFLILASNADSMHMVYFNIAALKARGVYEQAVLAAFVNISTNNHRWPLKDQRFLLEQADRARLLAAGDPLPEGERFTLYRGVAGRGASRRIGGFSWTADLEKARWFANRFPFHDPAVYVTEAARADVLAYVNAREEQESILIPERKVIRRL